MCRGRQTSRSSTKIRTKGLGIRRTFAVESMVETRDKKSGRGCRVPSTTASQKPATRLAGEMFQVRTPLSNDLFISGFFLHFRPLADDAGIQTLGRFYRERPEIPGLRVLEVGHQESSFDQLIPCFSCLNGNSVSCDVFVMCFSRHSLCLSLPASCLPTRRATT